MWICVVRRVCAWIRDSREAICEEVWVREEWKRKYNADLSVFLC